MRVNVSPQLILTSCARPGSDVQRGDQRCRSLVFETVGEVVMLKEILEDGERVLVIGQRRRGADRPARRTACATNPARRRLPAVRAPVGIRLRTDPQGRGRGAVLEEVPDISYSDIGGLSSQIEMIRDAVELPYLHKELFREHELRPPKGVLLYGPPGLWQDPHRQGGRQLFGQAGRGEDRPAMSARASSSTSKAPSCSTSTSERPNGTSGWFSNAPERRPAKARR